MRCRKIAMEGDTTMNIFLLKSLRPETYRETDNETEDPIQTRMDRAFWRIALLAALGFAALTVASLLAGW